LQVIIDQRVDFVVFRLSTILYLCTTNDYEYDPSSPNSSIGDQGTLVPD